MALHGRNQPGLKRGEKPARPLKEEQVQAIVRLAEGVDDSLQFVELRQLKTIRELVGKVIPHKKDREKICSGSSILTPQDTMGLADALPYVTAAQSRLAFWESGKKLYDLTIPEVPLPIRYLYSLRYRPTNRRIVDTENPPDRTLGAWLSSMEMPQGEDDAKNSFFTGGQLAEQTRTNYSRILGNTVIGPFDIDTLREVLGKKREEIGGIVLQLLLKALKHFYANKSRTKSDKSARLPVLSSQTFGGKQAQSYRVQGVIDALGNNKKPPNIRQKAAVTAARLLASVPREERELLNKELAKNFKELAEYPILSGCARRVFSFLQAPDLFCDDWLKALDIYSQPQPISPGKEQEKEKLSNDRRAALGLIGYFITQSAVSSEHKEILFSYLTRNLTENEEPKVLQASLYWLVRCPSNLHSDSFARKLASFIERMSEPLALPHSKRVCYDVLIAPEGHQYVRSKEDPSVITEPVAGILETVVAIYAKPDCLNLSVTQNALTLGRRCIAHWKGDSNKTDAQNNAYIAHTEELCRKLDPSFSTENLQPSRLPVASTQKKRVRRDLRERRVLSGLFDSIATELTSE